MRELVIGDLHGFYQGLKQALERANYSPSKDRLIQIGDIVDGLPNSIDIIDFFLQTEDKILIRGNHDFYALNYFLQPNDNTYNYWQTVGGSSTLKELRNKAVEPNSEKFEQYKTLFLDQKNYWVNEQNQLFVHGGISTFSEAENVPNESIYFLDRTMWQNAASGQLNVFTNNYKNVFIGHTTVYKSQDKISANSNANPLLRKNIWNLDTGAGWGGKVTVMDAATNQYWQSDFAPYSPR